jgi:UDP-glucuronate 4-epimerase
MQEIKNILITGDKGFIGSHLSKYLSNKGYNIFGVDRANGKEVIDITEEDVNSVNCVIHLAAQTSVWNDNYEQIINDNIISFIHIYELCKKLDKKFIYASSSCSVNITSAYGFSKLFNDIYAKGYGVGLRFHNVYGENSRKDTLLGICLNNNKITLYNNGLNYRHFTYIDDVCDAVIKALYLPDGLYNVVNPIENSVNEFVDEVLKYKDIEVTKVSEKRELDKERQDIDFSHVNLIDIPTTIKDGIGKILK